MYYIYIIAALATGALLGTAAPVQSSDLQIREVRDLTLYKLNDGYFKETSTYLTYAISQVPTADATLAVNPAVYVTGLKLKKEGTGFNIVLADRGFVGWNDADGSIGYNPNKETGWSVSQRTWNIRCWNSFGTDGGSAVCTFYRGDTAEKSCIGRDASGKWMQKKDCSVTNPSKDQLFQIAAYA